MSGAGSALMGIGSSRGDDRAVAAAEMAISSPLLEASIDGAHGVLLSIQGGSDLGLFEINEAAQLVANSAAVDANIIFGAVIDDALGDEVRVTVIAAGFDEARPSRTASAASVGGFRSSAAASGGAATGQAAGSAGTPGPGGSSTWGDGTGSGGRVSGGAAASGGFAASGAPSGGLNSAGAADGASHAGNGHGSAHGTGVPAPAAVQGPGSSGPASRSGPGSSAGSGSADGGGSFGGGPAETVGLGRGTDSGEQAADGSVGYVPAPVSFVSPDEDDELSATSGYSGGAKDDGGSGAGQSGQSWKDSGRPAAGEKVFDSRAGRRRPVVFEEDDDLDVPDLLK
jgi:cell division protein FtsZ